MMGGGRPCRFFLLVLSAAVTTSGFFARAAESSAAATHQSPRATATKLEATAEVEDNRVLAERFDPTNPAAEKARRTAIAARVRAILDGCEGGANCNRPASADDANAGSSKESSK